jgi:hypothetical protein
MRIRVIRSVLLVAGMMFLSGAAFAQLRISVRIAPPLMPVYEQPICPGDGYIWTPGYWGYGDDYYWVPGEWVMAPEPGYLWTPGYWGWGDDGYFFNDGYWGDEVGFYGGINYGFGYFGNGYEGGRWENGHFFYNTRMNNVNRSAIHNVYNTRVNEGTADHVSYNGGTGGTSAHATAQQEAAARGQHSPAVAAQNEHALAAHNDPQARVSANHGAAGVAAGGNAAERPESSARVASPAVHPKDLPAIERPAAPNTGNAKLDQKYQKQQDKLVASQNKDRQQLQQKQDNEHQQLAKQKSNEGRTQQVEQQHQQQTQQLQQTHTQQTQQMQQRQSAGGGASHGGGGRGH